MYVCACKFVYMNTNMYAYIYVYIKPSFHPQSTHKYIHTNTSHLRSEPQLSFCAFASLLKSRQASEESHNHSPIHAFYILNRVVAQLVT